MSPRFHAMLMVLAAALLAVAAGGCVEPLLPDNIDNSNGPEISILIRLPGGSRPSTKATISPQDDDETSIHHLQIWAFRNGNTHANERPVAYVIASNIGSWGEDPDDDVYTVILHLPESFLNLAPSAMNLDFYVLANGPSIGYPSAEKDEYLKTREQVRALTYGYSAADDPFGAQACTEVPSEGLPMSAFCEGVNVYAQLNPDLTPQQIQQSIPVVQLKRTVSRIRFIFSRLKDMNYVKINNVSIVPKPGSQTTGVIPKRVYVFTNSTASNPVAIPSENTGYETIAWSANLDYEDIHYPTSPGVTPATLLNSSYSEFSQDFEDFLQTDAVRNATTQQLVYFRETDQHLAVAIDYQFTRIDDEGREVIESYTQTIPLEGDNQVFPRNYTANLYAYFLEDQIHFSVSWDEWSFEDNGKSHIPLTNPTP